MKKFICILLLVAMAISVGAEEKKENTLTLNFYQRIVVLGMLPAKSDLATLLVSRDIRNKVKVTDEEKEKYDIVTTPRGGMTWNLEKVEKVELITVTLNESETKMLKDALKKANREKSIAAADDSIDVCKAIGDLN